MSKGGGGEPKTSPRRILAVKRQAQALELRMAGRSYQEIADALGYASGSGATLAVQAALDKTLRPPAEHFRALTSERLMKILQVFWPKMLQGDDAAAKVCFRALADLRSLLGLDAPIKVSVDIREEARRIAEEMGLDPDDVVREAEALIKAGAK